MARSARHAATSTRHRAGAAAMRRHYRNPSTMDLSDQDKARLDGSYGDAVALAMRVLTRSAQVMGAHTS